MSSQGFGRTEQSTCWFKHTWTPAGVFLALRKKDGKDQESIQSSTIPEPEYPMGIYLFILFMYVQL